MKNKKFLLVGLIIILVIGLFSVLTVAQNKYSHGDWDGHKKKWEGHYKVFDKATWLEKVGLPADATDEEIIEFKKSQWELKKDSYSKKGHKGSWCKS